MIKAKTVAGGATGLVLGYLALMGDVVVREVVRDDAYTLGVVCGEILEVMGPDPLGVLRYGGLGWFAGAGQVLGPVEKRTEEWATGGLVAQGRGDGSGGPMDGDLPDPPRSQNAKVGVVVGAGAASREAWSPGSGDEMVESKSVASKGASDAGMSTPEMGGIPLVEMGGAVSQGDPLVVPPAKRGAGAPLDWSNINLRNQKGLSDFCAWVRKKFDEQGVSESEVRKVWSEVSTRPPSSHPSDASDVGGESGEESPGEWNDKQGGPGKTGGAAAKGTQSRWETVSEVFERGRIGKVFSVDADLVVYAHLAPEMSNSAQQWIITATPDTGNYAEVPRFPEQDGAVMYVPPSFDGLLNAGDDCTPIVRTFMTPAQAWARFEGWIVQCVTWEKNGNMAQLQEYDAELWMKEFAQLWAILCQNAREKFAVDSVRFAEEIKHCVQLETMVGYLVMPDLSWKRKKEMFDRDPSDQENAPKVAALQTALEQLRAESNAAAQTQAARKPKNQPLESDAQPPFKRSVEFDVPMDAGTASNSAASAPRAEDVPMQS